MRRTATELQRSGGAGRSLAEIAAAHGYYDQSHMAAEFREFAGCPPTAWMAEEFRNLQAGAGWREPESSHDERDDWYDQY